MHGLVSASQCSLQALALIVYAMADDMLLFKRLRKRLPADHKKLCFAIYRRFGELGLRALCMLADWYPEPGGPGGMNPLTYLAYSPKLRKRDTEPLRELAVRRLLSGRPDMQQTALQILTRIGAPDSLRQTLVELVVTEATGDRSALYIFAADVLARRSRDRVLATELQQRIEAAYQAQEWLLLRRLVYALPKRAAWSLKVARSLLDRWSVMGPMVPMNCDTPEMVWQSVVEQCLSLLHRAKRLPEDWLDTELASPHRRDFLIAPHLIRTEDELTPTRRPAQVAAHSTNAHG